MSFHPSKIQFFGNGCKILNYYNLKSSPVYTIPKDSRSDWLSNNIYSPKNFKEIKTKSGAEYTELYNTRENYIHSSKIKKEPAFHFGKAGMKEDEFYQKTKIKKRPKTAKNKNINFKEEKINGDNCENNQNDNNNNNNNKGKEEEEKGHQQYYEIGTKFVYESRKPRAPLYSFAGGPFKENYLTTRLVENNFIPQTDFYEVSKKYVYESKKPRIVGHKFGKEKRLDTYIQKNKNKNNNNNKNIGFEEEKIGAGDNYANNVEQKNIPVQKNNIKEPTDFYEVNEKYVNESQKPRVLAYSFYKTSGVKPNIVEGKKGKDTFFYNLREKYINESQKPMAPKYSFGRPKPRQNVSNEKNKKNKNKKYKLRPQSAIFKNNSIKDVINDKQINKSINYKNGLGPGSYDIGGNFGENGLKISCSHLGRKYPKSNGFPGPGAYAPNYKVVKYREPIYSIGNEGKYDYYYDEYYRKTKRKNRSYGSQYYRRNPSWIIDKRFKGDLMFRIIKENKRYN